MSIETIWWVEAASNRDRLAERVLDRIESGIWSVEPEDLQFLESLIVRQKRSLDAVRLLATLGEEGYLPREPVCELLRKLLSQYLIGLPGVRIAAAEGLWQLTDRGAVPFLLKALDNEPYPWLRETLLHVLKVLG